MSKVLFLSNHFITLYSFRREFVKRLVDEGHEVILSLPEDPDNKFFEDMGCKIIITPIDRRGVNPVKDLKLIAFYKKMIKNVAPDIVYSYTIKPNIYGALAINKKFKQICTITGLGTFFVEKSFITPIAIFLYQISIPRAYKVFFQNTYDRDVFIRHHMVGKRYEVIPGSGCNLKEFVPLSMPEGEKIRFLYIGRVMRQKGIDTYLEAAKRIREKYPNTEFIIAGWNEDAEYKPIVEDYMNKGYVNYIGFRKDIKDWIRDTHCTVLPSFGEGIPNVILESAASARPCIGSDIPGHFATIEDGVTGYIFKTKDADSLTEVLEKFIRLSTEERTQMGLKGREKMEREFDRQIVIQKYMDELDLEDKDGKH